MPASFDCFISHWKTEYLLLSVTGKPSFLFYKSGSHLLSHTVSNAVSSAALVLTVVFGMGTGVSPERIATGKFLIIIRPAFYPGFVRSMYDTYITSSARLRSPH